MTTVEKKTNLVNEPEEFIVNNMIFRKIISWQEIDSRIFSLAGEINRDYKGKNPLFIIIMKGAMFFGMELLKRIELFCTFDTISAKSYGSKMQSIPNEVSIIHNNLELSGKDIIIIEDIVDTGYTLEKLLKIINSYKPKSVTVASLIAKPEKICTNISIDYLGFSVSSEFIIGCGMDFNEFGRNLKGIYQKIDN